MEEKDDLRSNSSEPKEKSNISRLDLRVGQVAEAKEHPIFKRYYLITLNVGQTSKRTSISRIAPTIDLRELSDKKLVVCCNIKEKVKGLHSDCFVVYAKSGKEINLLQVPAGAQPGDRVYVPGYPLDPLQDWPWLADGRRVFRRAIRPLRANDLGILKYNHKFLRTVQQGFIWTVLPYPQWTFSI